MTVEQRIREMEELAREILSHVAVLRMEVFPKKDTSKYLSEAERLKILQKRNKGRQ